MSGAPDVELVCAACDHRCDPRFGPPFRCPNLGDGRDHVYAVRLAADGAFQPRTDEAHPFLRYADLLAAGRLVRRATGSLARYERAVRKLDDALAEVAGVGLTSRPAARCDALSDVLGFDAGGGVWVLDETEQPSGSHKARHLFGVALWLDLAQSFGWADGGEPLAIASCGNAARAAAAIALAAGRELVVFVPDQAGESTLAELRRLDADVVVCAREADGPPGDPCLHAFHEAVADGAAPFSVQGPDNGLAVEGSRTIAWDAVGAEPAGFDRVHLQVGGGAFAAGFAQGAEEAVARGAWTRVPQLFAVQTASVAPLRPAWSTLAGWVAESGMDEALRRARAARAAVMRPVERPGTSVASAILDDETYDWLEVARAGIASGGAAQVVDEATLQRAHEVGRATTGIDACPTGTAGLAGLIAECDAGRVAPSERALVVFTGRAR